ncbi:MAG: tetratricopeptide repeat protein [Acetobacteraceae bacterium]
MRLSKLFPIVFAGALMLGAPLAVPALAQMDSREGIALQNQIYQLRQEIQQLRDQAGRGGGAVPSSRGGSAVSGDMLTQLLTRVDAVEEQVRQLRGRVDETQYQLQRQNADLNKRIEDLAFQLGATAPGSTGAPGALPPAPTTRPGAPAGPAPMPLTPPVPSTAPPAAPPPQANVPRTPERALQEGNAALARRDYAAAEHAAREVLTNRTSPRAYDAQFLLAQALAGQRQYPQAAIAYDDAYNRSKKGAYAADSLLGLAGALTALNEKKAACDTLNRLRVEFPQPRNDVRDGAAQLRQRAGCR